MSRSRGPRARAGTQSTSPRALPDDAGVSDVIYVIIGALVQVPVFFLIVWAFQIYITTSSLIGVVDRYVATPPSSRFHYAVTIYRATTGGNDGGLMRDTLVGPLVPHGLSVAYGWDGLLGPGVVQPSTPPVRWQIVSAQASVAHSFFFPLRLSMVGIAQVSEENRVATSS